MDFGYRRANQIIVHCRHMQNAVTRHCGRPNSEVHIVPHIILSDTKPRPTSDDGNTILFFGRIWEYKGLEYLIKAQPQITSERPTAKIVIAGRGEDFSRYRRMMSDPDRFVVINEDVSEEMRSELFSRASVVVLPYIDATQSGVVPIAYQFAKPVVATDIGGLPEMVVDGRTGFVVPPKDPASLALAIVRLLRNRSLRVRMGEAGKQKIETESSPSIVAAQTMRVYSIACNKSPSSVRLANTAA
jgi:glycosyltransferase involved in cell wall biosynthesis